jgi:NADH-quinone oxidoreductase subunit E
MPFSLSPDRERQLAELLPKYPTKMAVLLPALHLCQDQNGHIDDEIILFVANRLDVPPAHVKGVVTFYTLYNQHPVGKHQVWVCKTLPCALRGSAGILAHCEKKLGIHPGETTKDGLFTLRTAECLASCGTAPMMQIDKDYYENLTPARVDQILDGLAAGPVSGRGSVPPAGGRGSGQSDRPPS